MVSSNGKEQVSDGDGKEKRKWNGGDDDKTGRKNRGVLRFFEDPVLEKDEHSSDDSFEHRDEEFFTELNDNIDSGKDTPLPFIPKEEALSEEELERMYEERYKPGSGFVTYAEDLYYKDEGSSDDSFNDDLEEESFPDSGKATQLRYIPKVEMLSMEDLERLFEVRDKDPKDGYEPKKSSDKDICVPSAKDPTTWKVECTFGRERYSAFCLMQKYVDLDRGRTKLQIISAFTVDHVKGFIFVEAEKKSDVYEACEGISDVYTYIVTAVPSNEISGLLSVRSESTGVSDGMYKGDVRHVGATSILSPSRKVNFMTQSADYKLPTYAKQIREGQPSFFQGNLSFKAERKSQAFEKTKSRDSCRRGAPTLAQYLSGQSTPARACVPSKRRRQDTTVSTAEMTASPPPTRVGGLGKKPVCEAEGPAAGSVSLLGWDPEKVERTRDYIGRRPPFQISFLRSLLPNQNSLAIHPSMGAAMDACAMAWTEELGGYASTMAATDFSVCSAILSAQASVFNWEAHHVLMEDQKKYIAAQQENKKSSKKLKKYSEVIQGMSEQLSKARKRADLAEKVVLERERLQREVKAEKRGVMNVAYITAFQYTLSGKSRTPFRMLTPKAPG